MKDSAKRGSGSGTFYPNQRFSGPSFPPTILYKIFSQTSNIYLSGSNLISPGTAAARDSTRYMSPRTYMQNILMDEQQRDIHGIISKDEVVSRVEWVMYLNSMDKRPCYLGGRGNGWRELWVGCMWCLFVFLLQPG